MVGLQNKFKAANVHVSEPEGMIDIDLKTNIDRVIEINKKKFYKKQSCFKKLVIIIPIGILVTTIALLLLRTYLSDALNNQFYIKHKIIPTFEYSTIIFHKDVFNFAKLKVDDVRETVNNERQSKVKRDLISSNSADAFIPLESTPENLNYDKVLTLPHSNDMNASTTPSFLYFLSFYKGNHIKTVPNALPNQSAKILPNMDYKEWQESNFNSEATESTANFDKTDSIKTFSTDNLSTVTDELDTEPISSSSSSTSESYIPEDEYESSIIDFSTEHFSSSYTETPEFDPNISSDVITVTSTSDPTELDQLISEQNNQAATEISNNFVKTVTPNLPNIDSKEWSSDDLEVETSLSSESYIPHEHESTINVSTKNVSTKFTETSEIKSDATNLNNFTPTSVKAVASTRLKIYLHQPKLSKSMKVNQPFTESNPTKSTKKYNFNQFTTTDVLEKVTFANKESTTQFPTFKFDNIGLHSDDFKIETSSETSIPGENESTINNITQSFSTNYLETTEFNFKTYFKNNTIPQPLKSNQSEFDQLISSKNISLNNKERTQLTLPLLNEKFAVESNTSFHQTSDWIDSLKTKTSTPLTVSTNSIINVHKKFKYKLTIPPKYKTTTNFMTTKSELYSSNPKMDIVHKNSLKNHIKNLEYNTKTQLEEKATTQFAVPVSKQTNLYESTHQENLNNRIEMTTLYDNRNKTSSFNLFQNKFNDTTRNVQLKKRILRDFTAFFRKNKRASTMNQQIYNNQNSQFQLTPMKNNNNNNIKWQDQDFTSFEDDKNKGKESTSANLPIQTNQQSPMANQNYPMPNQNYPITNQNNPMTNQNYPMTNQNNPMTNQNYPMTNQNYPMAVCPSGVKILQQSNPYPYNYNFPSLYQNILPLSAPVNNPYMSPQNPYLGSSNFPPFYNNPSLQLGYPNYPNNFYGDNFLSNGQYYVCSSLSNPFMKTIPEVRKRNDFVLQKTNSLHDIKNGSRLVGECPFGEYRCNDGLKCIKRSQYCDNAVQCNDMSDEVDCSCVSRIDKSRVCDGYLDCPDGEDESNCFGCDEDAFNCDDWTPQDRFSTCIPLNQRCDGVVNCPNAKDEEKCSVLMEYFSIEQNFLVTYAKGFLYRNVGGNWYPVCRNPEMWANEACQLDGGGNHMSPLTHLIQTNVNYRGNYVSMSPKGQLNFDKTCDKNLAVFVECSLLVCGTRLKTRNYYRREEVDTSAEQIVAQSLNVDESVKNITDLDEDLLLGNSRVVGGKPSQPESWPWIVSIYRNGVFHCGGVLINEFWVVTAAHCVDKYWHYYFEIQAGLLRRYSYSPIVQSRVASHIIAHQLYDKMKLKNDIALIILDHPVRYNRYVRPICLPSELTGGENYMRNPQPNTICSAIGWGATSEHGSDPDHLREVDVPVLKNCKYKEDREGHEICAGLREGGKDACQGDSGGPFLCQNPNVANQWYLAGIVSHGEGCARPNEPGVYTRVSLYLEWIYENMRSNVQQRNQPLSYCPGYTCQDTKHCIPKQRHCDKIVDCLYADDEIDCDRSHFSEIFKHAIMDTLLARTDEDKFLNNQNIKWNQNQINHDNNDEPDNILGQTQNLDTSSELFETIAINNSIIKNVIKNKPFLCQKMLQTIDITKRCNKVHDCEDATDEENCICVDYLTYSHPEAVCDGVIDCFDASDEQNCPQKCQNNQFYCYLSNVCIESYKQCDGIDSCPTGEDERNCFALSGYKTITLGIDSHPVLNNDGFVSFYRNGTWKIICGNWNTTEGAQFATQICLYLGYHDYITFYKSSVSNQLLTVVQNGTSIKSRKKTTPYNKCAALKVSCSDTIDVTHEEQKIKKSFDHFEFIPWNAEIYVNGKYGCSGALLEKEWVVTTNVCFGRSFQLHSNYVAVLLGGRSKIYLNVRNAYEQVIRVVEYISVGVSNIALLRLEKEIIVSSYIRPLGLNVKQYNVKEKQVCVVARRNSSDQTELMYLKSTDTCHALGFRCFVKDKDVNNSSCHNETYTFWGGCVVCRSGRGWYPASIFFSHFGSCLRESESWSSIQYWKPNILQLMKQTKFFIAPPPCDGFRCTLGECIKNHLVCDGIPHCRDGKDEEVSYCTKRIENCTATQSCDCRPSDLKCKNGKCVEKFRFCDKVNDCGDWSDEPPKCDCRSYLEVTNPEKLGDGVRNCRDRTDEDPFMCKCSENKFRCEETNLCVSQEVVCDQISDCPNGEDESYCIEMTSSSEVQIRTAGVWHPGCFPEHLTTLELEDICKHLGYIGTSADRNETVKKISGRPIMDPFRGIIVNRIDQQPLIIAKREGDKPHITIKEDYNCYRLFLNCL